VWFDLSSEIKVTWEYLKNLSMALDSYKVRALIDAKDEILGAEVYSESQYDEIIFNLINLECEKYALLDFLKDNPALNLKALDKYCKDHSMNFNKVYGLFQLLLNEKLIKLHQSNEPSLNNNIFSLNSTIFKQSASVSVNDEAEIKSIYEPVKVIFDTSTCSGCGICAGICPLKCISISNGLGKIDENLCIRCGLCYFLCPRTFFSTNLNYLVQTENNTLQDFTDIGSHLEIYSARTKIPEIAAKCQDGGITSTCLYYLFDQKLIDRALGAQISSEPWKPEPIIIKSKEEVINISGTKYVNNPNLSVLNERDLLGQKVAVTGVPCQMQALLKAKWINYSNFIRNSIQYSIGIFCMESFSYESFIKICDALNIKVEDVRKTDINKGKFFVHAKDGSDHSIPIKEISHLARKDCEYCYDLTSESADLSIGSIGSPSGWNTVIIRNEKGKELYDALIQAQLIESKKIEEVKPGLDALLKVATSKRVRCAKHIKENYETHTRTPHY
jgi:coenzyme F420 hydrogenase subunit beta